MTDYWAGSGFVTDVLAPKFGALIIFAEHRYFGESIPFNNTKEGPWSPDNIAYCTSDQALADYAELIGYIKATLVRPHLTDILLTSRLILSAQVRRLSRLCSGWLLWRDAHHLAPGEVP